MRYKVYYGNTRARVYNGNSLCLLGLADSVKPSKHREEIEAYMENMNEPSISVSNNVATLTFDPIPQQMATWMVESRAVFFQVVRLSGGGSGHSCSNYRRKATKKWVRENFPYEWDWVKRGQTHNISITSEYADQQNRNITVSELTSGRIVRNVRHLNNFKICCNSGDIVYNICSDTGWYNQFYLGLIYFDATNKPSLYKMDKYDILIQY